ncbi:CDP-glycerol glycerophosphotransferase (TagB/SpsB family) [Lactobacillus colini]|uniref:CDP-glycerol glycerophosphotransferase (TagB/SpsB family) n=1 Tax=Lactobacillus colini TaxID=1819254 RepID=A0ABS4MFF7_9LACO|nr:CDP-glycerol glycerophosphotransferase family protein [Lactobacillus colini]MBP2058430.1 CDP-glycerol glycerophosphotransferase (TagB/SpsB family) [Lactobacillus colini]
MKSLFFRWYLSVMKFLAGLIPTKKNAAVILNGAGRSGSNGYIFYKYLQKNYPNLDVTLVEPWPSSHLPFSTWKRIGAAKYIFTTHQPFKIKSSQIDIEFWHGIPLKRMGLMANNTLRKDNQRNERLWYTSADVVSSSSDLYESLMSACIAISTDKYRKLGFPRLDALKQPVISKEDFLQDLFKSSDPQAQIGIYMPTFRYELEDKSIMKKIEDGNFFAFEDFEVEKLNNALKEKHQYLIVKLHPYEMKMFKNFDSQFSNIAFMNNDYLFDNNYDLYELLGLTDFLLTDFSSIYFDYLHLDKPILFVTNFLKQYEKTRGLLIGPYAEIAPGKCINSQTELIAALEKMDSAEMRAKRQYWLKLSDSLPEDENCRRVCEFLKLDQVK